MTISYPTPERRQQQRRRQRVEAETVEQLRANRDYWHARATQRAPAATVPVPPAAALTPALTPAQLARRNGEGEARAAAVEICRLCTEGGRADLIPQLIGKSPAEAKHELAVAMWEAAFDRARGRA